MKASDYTGYAGAGPDSMIKEDLANAVIIADLSYDEEHQGFSFMTYDEDQESDIWFNLYVDAANELGKDEFVKLLSLVGATKPGVLMAKLEELGYVQDTLDIHQARELMEALTIRRETTHHVQDESVLKRLKAQLAEGV
jgi:hypothetical protein